MYPELFKIPGLGWPINSYGFSIMAGFLLASWIAVRRAKPLGIKSDFILDLGIITMIAGILGAKVNYLMQYPEATASADKTLRSLWTDMGMNPLGALILGPLPFAYWFWRMRKSGEKVRLYSWRNGVLLVLTLFFALVGTRALYLYTHRAEYNWKVFTGWQSGFVLYGGLVAGVAVGVLYVKMRGQRLGVIADLAAGPMMLALAFGRLGCFLNGCCHGQPTDSFLGVSFPKDSPAAHAQHKGWGQPSDPVHPTQLYETAAGVAFFLLLSWCWKKKRKADGEVFLLMCMLYAAWRFLVEFIRGDERPAWLGELSYSQVVSMAVFAVAAVWTFLLRGRATRPPASAPGTGPEPPAAPAPNPPA